MHPWLDSKELATAVDSLPYRARRILFAWTANWLAGGDPARALHDLCRAEHRGLVCAGGAVAALVLRQELGQLCGAGFRGTIFVRPMF